MRPSLTSSFRKRKCSCVEHLDGDPMPPDYAPEEPPRTQSEIEISARVALRKTAAEREGFQHQIAKLRSENRRLEVRFNPILIRVNPT